MKVYKILSSILMIAFLISCSSEESIDDTSGGGSQPIGVFVGANSYSTSGNVTVTQIGENVEVKTAENFKAASASNVPMYLTNNENSISNAVLVADNVNRKSGVLTFTVENIQAADYKFLIQWCSAIKTTVGVAQLK